MSLPPTPPYGDEPIGFGPHGSQQHVAYIVEHGVQVDGLLALGMSVDTADGPMPAVGMIWLLRNEPVGVPVLVVIPPEAPEGVSEWGSMYDSAAVLARDGWANLHPDRTVAEVQAEAVPVVCPGCGRELFGHVADRGICLDCAPQPTDEGT